MLHNQGDENVESQIHALFKTIQFSKKENRKILRKWHAQSQHQMVNSFAGLNDGSTEVARDHNYMSQFRIELLERLKEIDHVLENQGEAAAEKLLKQYAGTVSKSVMYFAIFVLLFVIGSFIWMNQIMYS